MARLEFIRYVPMRSEVKDDGVSWDIVKGRSLIDGLPQIVWANCEPWREANLWALEQATSNRKKLETVVSLMRDLLAYAKWLDATPEMEWWQFPEREADRCLVQFRGGLVDGMDRGTVAPSVASRRIRSVTRFYKWVSSRRLLSTDWPMWAERIAHIRITDLFGFERTIQMPSTDLAIPNRARHGDALEDGLLPVSVADRDAIMEFTNDHASQELAWMLRLGFRTGMRIGSITDLRIGTLDRATPDPQMQGWFRLAIGPGARPPVATKFGVTGQVLIEGSDLCSLRDYFYSVRRLQRQAKAATEDRSLVFLNKNGKRYSGSGGSRAINVEMGRLRRAGVAAGIRAFNNFHFHQSRVTFATELARIAIKHGGAELAIEIVKEALLHKDEATTLRYIKFVKKGAAKAKIADAFTLEFLGLVTGRAH